MKLRMKGVASDPSGKFVCIDKRFLHEQMESMTDFDLRLWLGKAARVGTDGLIRVGASEPWLTEWEEPLPTTLVQ